MLPVRSVAGQVFVLHVVIVLVLAIAALVALVVQARHDSNREARTRSLAVAETFANTPNLDSVLRSPDPTAILQPRTEAARKAAGVDFIVVTDDRGYRYTHPFPSQIGLKINGRIRPAQHGRVVVQTVNSPLGRLVQVVVPVFDSHHQVVGLVASGITTNKISGAVYRGLPLLLGAVAAALLLATAGAALVSRRLLRQTRGLGPLEMTRMYEHHDAVLHAVREGVLIVGGDRRLLLVNDEARRLLDLPADPEGRRVTELGLDQEAARLLGSGRAATDEVLLVGERLLAVNQRPTDEHGGPPGWVTTVRDSTELRALSGRAEGARERLRLLYDASGDIGTTLDVQQTASELADVAVPRFADFVTVDLAEEVPDGDEPQTGGDAWMRRTAVSGIRGDHPLYPPGFRQVYAPSTPFASGLGSGQAVLERDLHAASSWQRQDAGHARLLLDYGIHSLITVPLRARGVLLGMVNFWRADQPEPFEEDDLALAEELAARAAVCIDNARRYTREHSTAVTLQHSLLPHGLPELTALDAAYRYLPAQAGVGGDWFDVLPLSGARVALVVGDVVGHGLHAAATMGRLRTAVHNFAALDLPPDELLGHLDELVARIDQETAGSDAEAPVAGATCLYAVYDPVSGLCTMARAGHLPPALVHPDGTVDFPDLPAGPPLGLGGLPFETAELTLPEGAALCLYTDGLVEDRDHDIDEGLEALRASLARRHGGDPETTCAGVLADLLPDRPADDVALLVARVRRLAPDRVAEWSVPAEASEVGVVRSEVTARLESWGLDELAFSTELILSELLTNSIRYASGPITVRLVLDSTLICEVADGSSTSPHLTYAAATDEGGRGLFLVAQFADRWGTRYTGTGKVIWTEQPLP
jgi:serine phosphatase RsbU (regulator of sigma subunit)/PAS domain-containing protein/anti-sigma regulatory factor (Ser/Thr protein kinase)